VSSSIRDIPAASEPPIVVEHREQLIYLLREAAELEHTILCEYLFAAFTMKQRAEEGLTAAQLEAVNRWRTTILTVAKQEMLHLTLVQNLLTAIGAAPHLSRPNLPTAAKHFPAGVQIALVPFGERALKHFLFLERPEGVALNDTDAQVAIERARPLMADEDIVPAPQEFATVGHLYRAIDVGFAWLTSTLGQEKLFIGPAPAQTSPDVMHWEGLVAVTDLESAHKAIDVVVEQGEGATGDWREAHFGTFLAIYDEFLALRAADPAFRTKRVADLFNVVNEIVLLALTRYFAHTDETAEQLALLENVGVGLMFAAIKPIGQLLTTLPFGPSAPGRTAGPTFELFYIGGYLLPHRHAAWTLIAERLRQAAGLAKRIESEGLVLKGVIAGLEKYAGQLESAA
jgi:hypothetical protein